MSRPRVLVACERNQFVTMAFRSKGIEAYNCDIQPCKGGHPEWHIQCDAIQMLKLPWDLIIAHPPCTYLTCAGAVRLYNKDHSIKDYERLMRGMEAAEFFNCFLNADCERIAVENPRMMEIFGVRKPDQYIEPYQFGHKWKKKTGLWLKNLPNLKPSNIVEPDGLWVGSSSAQRLGVSSSVMSLKSKRNAEIRSMTFPGIATAMAEQWGSLIKSV